MDLDEIAVQRVGAPGRVDGGVGVGLGGLELLGRPRQSLLEDPQAPFEQPRLGSYIARTVLERDRRLSDQVIGWVDRLVEQGAIEKRFNTPIFQGDGTKKDLLEQVGVAGVDNLSVPLGVAWLWQTLA